MASVTTRHLNKFSAVEYIKRLREVNFTDKQAEVVAEVMEQQVQIMNEQQSEIDFLKNRESATKGDLRETELRLQKEIEVVRRELATIRYETIKFIVWTGVGVVVVLGGMLAKGFHWF